MRPETIGRVLGIGIRVAGRVAGERLAAAPNAPQAPANPAPSVPNPPVPLDARHHPRAAQSKGSLGRGIAGFLRPFGRVGGKIWLEVCGVFFLLPVLVFAPTLWRTRFSYASGPDHRTFIASAIVVVVFFYLGVTSFWRARKR